MAHWGRAVNKTRLRLNQAGRGILLARRCAVPGAGDKKAILVVDDDQDVRRSVVQVLEVAGCHVRQAAHGFEALKQLESIGSAPCLVLLDMTMPETSGAAIMAVLAPSQRLAALPVVVYADKARRMLRKPVASSPRRGVLPGHVED